MSHAPFDLVIYHADCLDGFAAAWAAHKHSPGAEFVPAKYGDDPPDVEGKRVLIVDFSYPRDILTAMASGAADLLVLDHHKTAAADLAGLDFAVFDMERSGAGITWDELHPTRDRPALIKYVEDRDLWRFAFAETREFVAALQAYDFDLTVWDRLVWRNPDGLLDEGRAVLAYQRKLCESLASRAYNARLDIPESPGCVWCEPTLAVNCPPEFVSDIAEVLKPRAAGRAIVCWYFDGERGDFVFSLRSAEDGPDVSEIAQAFGGGGHEHAAGFRLDHNPLVKVAS